MSKVTKIVLITAGSLMALGIVLSIIGFAVFRRSVAASTNSGDAYEYKEEYIDEKFTNLDLMEVSHNIVFRPSEDGKVKIAYYDKSNYNHDIKVTNGTLQISVRTYEAGAPWWSRFTFHIDLDGFGTSNEDPTTTIYLPEDSYGSLKINTTSGDIQIPEKYAFDGVKFNTVSGDVEALCSMTGSIEADTTSGEVTFKNLNATDLDIDTISGNIVVSDSTVSGITSISATSGEISLTKLKTTDLKTNTVSGDVRLEDLDTKTANIDTTSGDVSGNILGDHEYDVDTTSGEVELPSNIKGMDLIEIDTTSGDVNLR